MEIKSKILLVDDKPENLISLEKLLKDFDVEILTANSGNEALTLTLTHEFAIALIDVQMPEMDGYETVQLMRNVEQTKYLPVIFISAIYSNNHYKIHGIESGAVDFISKPVHPRILQGKVKVFLDLYRQRKQLENEIERRKIIEEDLRKAEKEISIAKEKAEESDRLKTAFLANMSHEIRTPLNAIVGFSNLLGESKLEDSKRKQFLSYINNSSESLTTLISDIIDTAKIEAGQLEIVPGPVNISAMLTELFETTKVNLKRLNKENISLILTLPENIGTYTLFLDGIRLKQIFLNLLTNATKFTDEGSIEFGFYFSKHNNPHFFVKDTGIGIIKEQQDYIFDRFRKANPESENNSAGTGLGLSIVKKILELMGGDICLESEPGKGSDFLFTVTAEEHKISPVTSEKVKKEKAIKDKPEDKIMKILIAEDEVLNYELLKEILPKNAESFWAKNGQEAIDIISSRKIDLILMDIKMPVKSGYEALKEIRALFPKLPIIAQTAYAMEGEKETILDFGFDAYIAKPIKKSDLLSLISNLTNNNVTQ